MRLLKIIFIITVILIAIPLINKAKHELSEKWDSLKVFGEAAKKMQDYKK